MKAVTGELPVGEAWSFEVKWDGMRVVAAIGDPQQPLRLDTTRGNDATDRFPELGGLPARLAPHRVVLDGEVVAFGDDGRPNFGLLQHRMHLARPADAARVAATIPVCYVVFDLLWLDGQDLTGFTYVERRHLLTELVEPGDGLLVPHTNSVTAPTCSRPLGRAGSKGSWPSGSTASTAPAPAARCGARSRSGLARSS
jgi:bifunctional non-homologous end joining protein LigD